MEPPKPPSRDRWDDKTATLAACLQLLLEIHRLQVGGVLPQDSAGPARGEAGQPAL